MATSFDEQDLFVTKDPPKGAEQALLDGLEEHSKRANPGNWSYKKHNLFVGYYGPGVKPIEEGQEDGGPATEQPKLLGGCFANTWASQLYICLLHVDESLRGQRVGTALLARAEQIGKERGARGSYLNTFSYQAGGFYEKQGYKLLYKIEDCFDGTASRHYYGKVFK